MECFEPITREAERLAATAPGSALRKLRELPLDDFGLLLLSMPDGKLPHLSSMLPRMADAETQRNWTGAEGETLLRQSLNFIRIMSHAYTELTGTSLRQKRVLDFGIGWGRLARLMYYYCDPDLIYGCDPWDASLNICRDNGLACHLAQSDYIPTSLPFSGPFDLVYAFSVFTHLSERATRTSLSTLAQQVSDRGVLALTIRPVEYWGYHQHSDETRRAQLRIEHRKSGFAFFPHNREKVDGDITYGDTSMSFEWLETNVSGLRIRQFQRSIDDPLQVVMLFTR